MGRDLSEVDVAVIVERYERDAVAHGGYTESGDYKKGNRCAKRVAEAYAELRRRGCLAQRSLLVLLDHADPHVRGWAAAHALEFAPDDGEAALRALAADGDGIVAFNASMTLKTWEQGALTFP